LLIISCVIITYMYFFFFIHPNTNNTPLWSVNNKTFYILNNSIESSNNISTFINWFILLIGAALLTLKFRYNIFYHAYLIKSIFFISFSFFLFVVLNVFN
jgi:hypothetical protein